MPEETKTKISDLLVIPEQVELLAFLIHLVLCALVSFLLYCIYRRWGFSLSNRADFGRNFVLLSCTTTLIVSIVKSSLALSLGLVGALSIVRFRAAIKEPEELCFLFLAIAIGLGFGAGEALVTVSAFAFMVLLLWIRSLSITRETESDYHLVVTSAAPRQVGLEQIQKVLVSGAQSARLKRIDESTDQLEVSYQVQFSGAFQLESCHQQLLLLGDGVSVSLMDNRGIGN